MALSRKFDRTKDCVICQREIDDVNVMLKQLTIGGDTYRQYDPAFLSKTKFEKICTDCFAGRPVYFKSEEKNDLL
jgi:hypothetical protein